MRYSLYTSSWCWVPIAVRLEIIYMLRDQPKEPNLRNRRRRRGMKKKLFRPVQQRRESNPVWYQGIVAAGTHTRTALKKVTNTIRSFRTKDADARTVHVRNSAITYPRRIHYLCITVCWQPLVVNLTWPSKMRLGGWIFFRCIHLTPMSWLVYTRMQKEGSHRTGFRQNDKKKLRPGSTCDTVMFTFPLTCCCRRRRWHRNLISP